MTIGDRISVLKQELKVSSTRSLEKGNLPDEKWVISNGLLATWENEDPSIFVSNKLEKFLNHYQVNREWWRTGKGEVLIKKLTDEQKAGDNKEMDLDEAIKKVIEGQTEYVMLPRIILQESMLVSKDQVANDRKMMDKLLDQNEKLIAEVLASKAQLASVQK